MVGRLRAATADPSTLAASVSIGTPAAVTIEIRTSWIKSDGSYDFYNSKVRYEEAGRLHSQDEAGGL